jgi:hypothetical protein
MGARPGQFEDVPLARPREAGHRDIVMWLVDSLVCIDEHSDRAWQFDYEFEMVPSASSASRLC